MRQAESCREVEKPVSLSGGIAEIPKLPMCGRKETRPTR